MPTRTVDRGPKPEWEAKPCPWCGMVPSIEPWHGGGPQKRRLSCENERCAVAPHITASTRRRALVTWNSRAQPQGRHP